jgi:hypothetical protein
MKSDQKAPSRHVPSFDPDRAPRPTGEFIIAVMLFVAAVYFGGHVAPLVWTDLLGLLELLRGRP